MRRTSVLCSAMERAMLPLPSFLPLPLLILPHLARACPVSGRWLLLIYKLPAAALLFQYDRQRCVLWFFPNQAY